MPDGADVFDFESTDNAKLRGATFETEHARACVVLMTGRSEFIEKYFEVVCELQTRGFSVAMMDWRGQGLSERLLPTGEKGHITDFGAYKADLQYFTENYAMKKFSNPYILMTHSMGGVPALQLLADGYDKFIGAVLCAPMTQLFGDPIKRWMIKIIAGSACRLGATRRSVPGVKEHSVDFKGNVLTSDQVRHSRFAELQAVAPNAIIREPTYGWVKAANDAMDNLHKSRRFDTLKTPLRIISAEDDHLVDTNDHATIAERSRLIDRIVIEGALHEILMERDEHREAYWRAFDEFIDPLIAAH